jgi:hypothetical protein
MELQPGFYVSTTSISLVMFICVMTFSLQGASESVKIQYIRDHTRVCYAVPGNWPACAHGDKLEGEQVG